jgi:hypothetical protein
VRIFSSTAGSSMQTIILTAPLHARQVSMAVSPEAPTRAAGRLHRYVVWRRHCGRRGITQRRCLCIRAGVFPPNPLRSR